MQEENVRFPIGKFEKPETITPEIRNQWIEEIASFPKHIEQEVGHLTDQQLNTPYRKEGWSIRQVVHHCADSHMNSFIRFKLALTEENPTIKPYFEDRWAELADSQPFEIDASLKILKGLHARWTGLLSRMDEKDFQRTFVHPEHGTCIQLDENLGIYAWHCNHHLAHIANCKKQNNW